MSKKVAINGFGRIGRLTFRNLLEQPGIEVVAINDLTDNGTLAHLLKFDSSQGAFDGTVESTDEHLIVNGQKIRASAERNPANLPWKELGVDVVLECTGLFLAADKAQMHLDAGAQRVILSAPGKSDGIKTIVLGVNEEELDISHKIFSNASCTTNCFAPVMRLIQDNWGVQFGSMTTTHAYTGDQKIQDGPHKDLRRARAAAINIVPTSTGAAKAIGSVVPEVAGKLNAIAVRVPVVSGSMIEVNVVTDKATTAEEVNSVFKAAAEGKMKGVLEYSTDPLVSTDILQNKHSSIFDSKMTNVLNGNFVKVVSWYDNEAGYSARLCDLTTKICGLL